MHITRLCLFQDDADEEAQIKDLLRAVGLPLSAVAAVWPLCPLSRHHDMPAAIHEHVPHENFIDAAWRMSAVVASSTASPSPSGMVFASEPRLRFTGYPLSLRIEP